MHMDHMGSQARYVLCTMICSRWARRPDMQGRKACIMHMDYMGSQARYAPCAMICSRWACRPDMQVSKAFIVYMKHMGSQVRYALCAMTCSRWARGPYMQGRKAVCIMYMEPMGSQARYASCNNDIHHMGSQARYARQSDRMNHVYGTYISYGLKCYACFCTGHLVAKIALDFERSHQTRSLRVPRVTTIRHASHAVGTVSSAGHNLGFIFM